VPALQQLRCWLEEHGCTSVAIESTGSYWIPVKNVLEGALEMVLVCSRKHHPKKGDKTDFRDAMGLVHYHRHGLLTGSYLPGRRIVELRDLTRRRKKLLGDWRGEKNRIQKVLETANVKIGNIIGDMFGVSGQEMLKALLSGKELPASQIAGLAKRRLRLKLPELEEALQQHQLNEHHRWLINQSIEHLVLLDRQLEQLESKILEYLQPYRTQYDLLMTIPGVKEHTAATILAEIGPDMSVFPTGGQLCSWSGICPGNNRSAGKSKAAHIKKANKFLLTALVEASWGAARTGDSKFQAQFQRWSRNLGRKKAVIAVCHSLLRTVHAMLRDQQPYREPDPAAGAAREREKRIRHHAKRLRDLGMDAQACDQLIEQLMAAPVPGTPRRAPAYRVSQRPVGPCRGALGFPARQTRPQRRRTM
jgi:transposase